MEPCQVPLCLFRQDVSTDIQYSYDLPWWFIRSGRFNWPKVKFSKWAFGVKMHMFRCVFTRGIRWCFGFTSIFQVQKLFAETLIFPKATYFCLTYPGKVKVSPKVVKLGMVGFRRSRNFCLYLLRSSVSIREQTSRWGWQPPPPPARCGLNGEIGGAGEG